MAYSKYDFLGEKYTRKAWQGQAVLDQIGQTISRVEALKMVPPSIKYWIEQESVKQGKAITQMPVHYFKCVVKDHPEGRVNIQALETLLNYQDKNLPRGILNDARAYAKAHLERIAAGDQALQLDRALWYADEDVEEEVEDTEEDTSASLEDLDVPPSDLLELEEEEEEETQSPDEAEVETSQEEDDSVPEDEDVVLPLDIFDRMSEEDQQAFMDFVTEQTIIQDVDAAELPEAELQRLYNKWVESLPKGKKVELFSMAGVA